MIKFLPSFNKYGCPTDMFWVTYSLPGGEYGRRCICDRNHWRKMQNNVRKPKKIINDYYNWIERRRPKPKQVKDKFIWPRPKVPKYCKCLTQYQAQSQAQCQRHYHQYQNQWMFPHYGYNCLCYEPQNIKY